MNQAPTRDKSNPDKEANPRLLNKSSLFIKKVGLMNQAPPIKDVDLMKQIPRDESSRKGSIKPYTIV